MKKIVSLLLVSCFLMLFLPTTLAGDNEITYVTLGNTGMEVLEEAAKEFEKETGIKVNFESWSYSDAYSKILTLAEGGNMPDAMYGFSSWTVQFKEAGYTVALDNLISEKLYNDFTEGARKVCSVDGELWSMPSYMSIRSVLINQKAFDEINAKAPTTWMELLDYAPALYEGQTCPYAYTLVAGHPKNTVDCFLPILWAYGSDVLTEDQKAVAFNSKEGVAALQMYVDLAKYSVPDYGEATINETQSNFTTQTAAAYFHNAQGLAALRDAGEDYSWATILQPLAGPGGEAYSYGVMDVDLVFKTGKEDKAAKWLEFWHQAKYQGKVIDKAGWVPNQASHFEEMPIFTDESNLLVAPFAKMNTNIKFKPSITCWEEIQKILADHITKAVFEQMTAEEAFAEAEKQCNAVLAAQ
ncbi:MAG: extracellular solute-binding protein [Eubacteriales bacterium]|nr:extracellular solute-binding protein [Eubacteriales bacterium]